MEKKTGLGKGLDALFFAENNPMNTIASETAENNGTGNAVTMLDVHLIDNNTKQPRKDFDEEKLNELCESIKQHGVVQPIIVTKRGDRYLIVAGERRYRASRLAGLTEVPAIIREMAENEVLEIALIENIQREDLNPVEEAIAVRYLMQQQSLTQEQVAQKLGKNRTTITNCLRILNLPDSIHQYIRNGELQMGHAKVLLSAKEEMREELATRAAEEGWTVKMLESKVLGEKKTKEPSAKRKKEDLRDPAIVDAENEMRKFMGTKVQISGDLNRGKIVIEYYSPETLEAIYNLVCHEQ
ncbi:MAG: ParB/RepB/Spo0J family partition protein [Clostridia bacterium]|nr:ParB/RepB/Spo0J family partition protein [Clostridia bacterium]